MFDGAPEGWKQTTLGTVATLSGGTTPSKAEPGYWSDGTISWATPSDITSLPLGESQIRHTSLTVSERAIRECSLPLNPPGTVLLTSRATIGFAAINDVPMTTNQGFITFNCRDKADPYFLYQWLIANRNLLVSAAGGSTFKELSRSTAKLLPILLPPLSEQQRIAEILRSVDETTAKYADVLSNLKEVQRTSFQAFLQSGHADTASAPIFGWTTGRIENVTSLPSDWSIVRLIDVAKLESGHTPSRRVPSYWEDGHIDWISLHDTKNLERAEITSTAMKITADGLKNSSARLLPKGTVCFSRTATVGKCVIMGHSMATSQDFANFICSEKLNNRYLMHLLRWMQPIWKQLSSGSTHKTIYMPTFQSLQIVLPTRTAQDEIVGAMDSLTTAIDENTEALVRHQQLKKTLATDLLSGRVRVPA